jgi:hypothetical protein
LGEGEQVLNRRSRRARRFQGGAGSSLTLAATSEEGGGGEGEDGEVLHGWGRVIPEGRSWLCGGGGSGRPALPVLGYLGGLGLSGWDVEVGGEVGVFDL